MLIGYHAAALAAGKGVSRMRRTGRSSYGLMLLLSTGLGCTSTVAEPTGAGGAAQVGGAGGGATGLGGAAGGPGGVGGARGSGGAGLGGAGVDGGADAGPALHNPLSQTLINAFVTAHNQARSSTLTPPPAPALPPVTWDPILADTAYNYLLRCVSTSADHALVDHNAGRTTDYAALGGSGYVGENIYASTGTPTPMDAVASWMSEAPQFDYATSPIGTAGHYTQVVWRASVRIGCAIVNCPSVTYHDTVLCDYAPGGNITNQRPY
jgi:pathogenesis-related protein 1